MRIEQIVVNASPLIVLLRSGLADLLPQLFREIVIPETVWYEIVAGGHLDQAASGLPNRPLGQAKVDWVVVTDHGMEPGCGGIGSVDVRAGESIVPGCAG
jgi:hypothetical protein